MARHHRLENIVRAVTRQLYGDGASVLDRPPPELTVKLRTGVYEGQCNAHKLIPALERLGVSMVTVGILSPWLRSVSYLHGYNRYIISMVSVCILSSWLQSVSYLRSYIRYLKSVATVCILSSWLQSVSYLQLLFLLHLYSYCRYLVSIVRVGLHLHGYAMFRVTVVSGGYNTSLSHSST